MASVACVSHPSTTHAPALGKSRDAQLFYESNSFEMAVLTRISLPTPTALRHFAYVLSLNALHEANPMMGLRGCRLGIVHPEITKMQVRLNRHTRV